MLDRYRNIDQWQWTVELELHRREWWHDGKLHGTSAATGTHHRRLWRGQWCPNPYEAA
jgi:hypothetical protein